MSEMNRRSLSALYRAVLVIAKYKTEEPMRRKELFKSLSENNRQFRKCFPAKFVVRSVILMFQLIDARKPPCRCYVHTFRLTDK